MASRLRFEAWPDRVWAPFHHRGNCVQASHTFCGSDSTAIAWVTVKPALLTSLVSACSAVVAVASLPAGATMAASAARLRSVFIGCPP